MAATHVQNLKSLDGRCWGVEIGGVIQVGLVELLVLLCFFEQFAEEFFAVHWGGLNLILLK